jgi:hypothetical protein
MARPRTITALFTRARQRQQVLFDWMRSHHDDLAAELARDRGRWDQALQVIADLKLVDDRGNPPTRDTIVRTWKRVRDDVVAARAKQEAARSAQALAPGEVAPGVRAVAQPRAAAPTPAFRPDQAGKAAAPGAEPNSDPLQRLRASMEAGKVPMPRTVR